MPLDFYTLGKNQQGTDLSENLSRDSIFIEKHICQTALLIFKQRTMSHMGI